MKCFNFYYWKYYISFHWYSSNYHIELIPYISFSLFRHRQIDSVILKETNIYKSPDLWLTIGFLLWSLTIGYNESWSIEYRVEENDFVR